MKAKNIISVVLLLVLVSATSSAQNSWQWAARAGGVGMGNSSPDATINGMVTDAAGNVYVCGTILGPGATAGSLPLITYGSYDIYIAKYDCAGNLLWARTAGSTAVDHANDIAIDAAANIYVTGQIAASSVFPFTFIDTTITEPTTDMFIAKIDSSGNRIWIKTASPGAPNLNSIGYKIRIDINNNLNVCFGSATSGILFPGYPVVRGIYRARLDTAGNMLNLLAISEVDFVGGIGDYNISNTLDEYVTGRFSSDSIVFGNNDTVLFKMATSFSGSDIFLTKFDSIGNFIWARHFGNSDPTGISGRGIDFYNNYIIFTGDGKNGLVVGSDTLNNNLSQNFTFPFVSLISFDGNILWSVNAHNQYGNSPSGGIKVIGNYAYIGGLYGGQAIYGSTNFNSSNGLRDIFIAEVDLITQSFSNAVKIDGTGSKEEPQTITADASGNIYIGGAFDGTMTVGSSTITSAGGNTDAFIAKWGPGACITSIDEIVADLPSNSLFIYPNPAKELFNITAKDLKGEVIISIYNTIGQQVKRRLENLTNNTTIELNIKNLPTGVYFVVVTDGTESRSGKVVVE